MAIPPLKRQSFEPLNLFRSNSMVTETTLSTTLSEVETRPWSDIPHDLLSPIADKLGLIELLSFRGTCKDWHSGSSPASAKIESAPCHKPWFLLYGQENSQCILYNESNKRKYTINIPELEGATCLASNYGWLLLLSREGSLFFFSPFSRAKIELPQFPHLDLSGHVAAISSPPTSKECVICVINRQDQLKVELNLLHRGAETWTRIDYICAQQALATIAGATFHEGTFHFLDNTTKGMTYSLNKKKCGGYTIIEPKQEKSPDDDYLPFGYKRSHFRNVGMKNCLELEENVSISTCGTSVLGHEYDMVILNESIEASKVSDQSRHLKGIWIQPRFLQIPPNQSWSL